MNEPKKLTIRINIRPEKDGTSQEEQRCNYHWGRIIVVSLATIVAITSLISAGAYYLNQDQIDSESDTDKSITSPAKKEAVRTIFKAASQDEAQLTVTALQAAEKNSPTAERESRKTPSVPLEEPAIQAAEISTSAISPPVIKNKATITPEIVAVSEKVTDIKSAATQTETVSTEVTVMTPAAEEKSVSERLFIQSQKKLLSDNITRFVISQAVEGNEPIGTIDDIHFDRNNIATVYAYSDVNGLKDQTLYYKWSLDGKNIAMVRVKVGSNRWRSYSSKFIKPDMRGQWKVELQNQAGKNLAINQFNY